jgi:hypothetical protein
MFSCWACRGNSGWENLFVKEIYRVGGAMFVVFLLWFHFLVGLLCFRGKVLGTLLPLYQGCALCLLSDARPAP